MSLFRLTLTIALLINASVGFSDSVRFLGDGEHSDAVVEVTGEKAILYLAKKPTNEPLEGVEPEFEPFPNDEENFSFAKTKEPGIYEAKVKPDYKWDGQIIITLDGEVDAIPLQAEDNDAHHHHEEENKATTSPFGWVIPVVASLAGFFVGLGIAWLFMRRRTRIVIGTMELDKSKGVAPVSKEKIALSIMALLAGLSIGNKEALSHEGHSHDGPEASAGGNGTAVKLPKKSQFLMGLRTTPALEVPINATVGTFGHVIPNPQNDAAVSAPSAGVINLKAGVHWGQQVRKGETLATLSAIGELPITSPVAGKILEIKVPSGKRVEAGEVLFRIVNSSKLWVDAELYESDLRKIADAKEAFISVQGRKDTLPAKVLSARTAIDESTLTAKVFLEITNPSEDLRIGSYVGVSFIAEDSQAKGIVLPKEAVLYRGADRIVFAQVGPESFEAKPVVVREHPDPHFVIIEKGLDADERIVVKGNYQLLVGL